MIPGDELRDAEPIGGENRLRHEVACDEVSEKPRLRGPADALLEEIDDFADDELRHNDLPFVRLEERQASFVIAVGLVVIGVERT